MADLEDAVGPFGEDQNANGKGKGAQDLDDDELEDNKITAQDGVSYDCEEDAIAGMKIKAVEPLVS